MPSTPIVNLSDVVPLRRYAQLTSVEAGENNGYMDELVYEAYKLKVVP
ncbi:MAG: hypothetical protein VX823_08405 [Actinomycetota bacterium]|nr:hypothetical protein [Actinomycetota bacterium]MED6305127.1 hypothetical protein [Actinomycetota bacterium]